MQVKLKICSVCNDPCVLWVSTPKMCRNCAVLSKAKEKQQQARLTQTEDGAEAKVFPVKKYQTVQIKKVSTRQQRLNTAYNVQAKVYKKNNPVCKARVKCIGSQTTDVHHKKGRGEYLLDESTWLPVCRECHNWINENNKQAMALGLCESRLSKAI